MGISTENAQRSKYCVLSVSKSWFAGLWIADGIRPLIMCDALITGLSTSSPLKKSFAASSTVRINRGCEMVNSLSLANTGVIQSFCNWSKVTSTVLASMKCFVLFRTFTSLTGSIISASEKSNLLPFRTAGIKTCSIKMKFEVNKM